MRSTKRRAWSIAAVGSVLLPSQASRPKSISPISSATTAACSAFAAKARAPRIAARRSWRRSASMRPRFPPTPSHSRIFRPRCATPANASRMRSRSSSRRMAMRPSTASPQNSPDPMLTCDSYLSPGSLGDALAAVAASDGHFRFVAGATDLLPWAREGRAGDVHVPLMVDISGVPELRAIEFRGRRVRIGAATPFQRFLDSPDLIRALPGMPDCAVWFADNQIRESATIGGNVVNASPAGDGIPPLLTANATVELAALRDGNVRRRKMALDEFIKGPGLTAAEHDEILLGVECDTLDGYGGAFAKAGHRRSLVISGVCLAAVGTMDPSGHKFQDVRLAIGGVGPTAKRMTAVEDRLNGQPVGADLLRDVMLSCDRFVQSRTRQEYRKLVASGFLARGLA